MGLTVMQVVLLTALAYLKAMDWNTTQITAFDTMIYGVFAGLILGDFKTGLMIGATLQLMSLGIAAVGGSSMPDYPVAAIIATAVSVTTGQGMAAGMALGVPVGMLCINLDVLIKLLNSAIAKKALSYVNKKEFKKMRRIIPVSTFIFPLEAAVPVLIAVIFGKPVVEAILGFMPAWFTVGLNVAGAMLPAVGIAMLLTYMPLKEYGYWLLVGFVFAAYLKVPTLGIAFLGAAAGIATYKKLADKHEAAETNNSTSSTKEDMEDE